MVRRELIIGGRDPLTPAASLFLRGWLRGVGVYGKKMYRTRVLNSSLIMLVIVSHSSVKIPILDFTKSGTTL